MSYKNKTVIRTMDILNLFIDHPELSFQEIIDLSGIPKTSVYRMIMSLESMGFIEKGTDSKYRLGLIFLRFGDLVSSRLDIRRIAYPIMQRLHNELEESVNLIIKHGESEAIYIEKIDLRQKVRLFTAVGRKSPLYAGACSRIILAHMTDDEIQDYLNKTELKSHSSGTITNKGKLLEVIEKSRDKGYTVSHSELHEHTSEIAAPIFNHTGDAVAALSIAGMTANYQDRNIRDYTSKLLIATAEISSLLGYKV